MPAGLGILSIQGFSSLKPEFGEEPHKIADLID